MDYGDMNWLAIVCAGLAYWLLGAVWYSALFSKVWRSAVEQHGVKLGQPNQSGMATKLIRDPGLQLNRGSRLSPSHTSTARRRSATRPENWCRCWSGVLCHRVDHDLCLAIAAPETLGDRYRVSHRRLHYHGRYFVDLALV